MNPMNGVYSEKLINTHELQIYNNNVVLKTNKCKSLGMNILYKLIK